MALHTSIKEVEREAIMVCKFHRMASRRLLPCAVVLLLTFPLCAQTGSISPEVSPQGDRWFDRFVGIVRVNVIVVDRKGNTVEGLSAANFVVKDAGVIQKLASAAYDTTDTHRLYVLSYRDPSLLTECRTPAVTVELRKAQRGAHVSSLKLHTVDDLVPGNMELPAGYRHCTDLGTDSWVGRIQKPGGLKIQWDIGEMAGVAAECADSDCTKGVMWRKEETINGHRAMIVYAEKDLGQRVREINQGHAQIDWHPSIVKLLLVSFPETRANFSAHVDSQSDIDEMMAIMRTYQTHLPAR